MMFIENIDNFASIWCVFRLLIIRVVVYKHGSSAHWLKSWKPKLVGLDKKQNALQCSHAEGLELFT